jgi:hypothetical protein
MGILRSVHLSFYLEKYELFLRWCSTWLYVLGGTLLITIKPPVWIWAFLCAHLILLSISLDAKDLRLIFQYTFLIILDFFLIVHLFLMR